MGVSGGGGGGGGGGMTKVRAVSECTQNKGSGWSKECGGP